MMFPHIAAALLFSLAQPVWAPLSSTPPAPVENLATSVSKLQVSPERPAGYRRSLFPHWDTLTDGCSVRESVLIAESTSPASVSSRFCTVYSGTWTSLYDGKVVSDPRSLDIDHVVALKEAWDSGAHSWSPETRRRFANDLSDPRSLIAVSASSNRIKSDKDPAQWLPRESDRCRYVSDWVAVKLRWNLSVDKVELAALQKVATACDK